jgi:hypothetical protein
MSTEPNYADTLRFANLWPGAELQGTLIIPRATRAGICSKQAFFRSEKGVFALTLSRHLSMRYRLSRLTAREAEAAAKAFKLSAAAVKAMRDLAAKQEVEEAVSHNLANLERQAKNLGFRLVPTARKSRKPGAK